MSYDAPWKHSIVISTAEANAIRCRICVVSRTRDAEYGLVARMEGSPLAESQATRLPLQSRAGRLRLAADVDQRSEIRGLSIGAAKAMIRAEDGMSTLQEIKT